MASRPVQLHLFEDVPSFNVEPDIKKAMQQAVDECGLSRAQVVDELNRVGKRFGVHLTKGNGGLSVATFEKWLNPNADGNFPSVKALLIFCAVLKDCGLKVLNILVKPLGYQVIGRRDAQLLDWAREYHRVKNSQKKMRQLAQDISGDEG